MQWIITFRSERSETYQILENRLQNSTMDYCVGGTITIIPTFLTSLTSRGLGRNNISTRDEIEDPAFSRSSLLNNRLQEVSEIKFLSRIS
jgi:hypothetical protein